ncbi:MAG: diaminopimelate decarboxylase [Polyangiaceae bacterium]
MRLLRDSSHELLLGGVSLTALASDCGTPTYAYDVDAMVAEAESLTKAFDQAPHRVAYAVKACAAGAIVRALATAGCGADVVSGAELLLAIACGIGPDRIVYSGVAKTDDELDCAIAKGILAIQVESVEEISRVQARARAAGRTARVGIRINPGIDVEGATHAHIATGHDRAKFGVPGADVTRAVELVDASPGLELVGMAAHVGSHLTEVEPYLESARVLFRRVRALRDDGRARSLRFVDTGGGFGVDYGEGGGSDAPVPRPADFVRAVRAEQRALGLDDLALFVEPGRSLVAPHGVLLASVIQTKVAEAARWLMIDAGMNDLIRPALYQARHRIVPLRGDGDGATAVAWRVVGPVCESSDDFGEHLLPRDAPAAVAILDAGAYGYSMASRYNGRQLPVEVFVRGGRAVARTRRATAEEWADERAKVGL